MLKFKFKYKKYLYIGLLVLAGFGSGYFWAYSKLSVQFRGVNLLRSTDGKFSFINPLVGVEFAPDQDFPELRGLNSFISRYVNDEIKSGGADRISVYIRNIVNAHWFAINKNEKFDPGSLLKVPIMMAYYKEAELTPSILNKRIYYAKHLNSKSLPNELVSNLKPNAEYTVEELIQAMIIDSDNAAKDLLIDNIDPRYLNEVYDDLGIPIQENLISASTYASFFRRLYNATFLDRYYSEKALKLLSQTTFKDGIVKGLPAKISVAHKYGERGVYDNQGNLTDFELHDCGIVYFTDKSVLLCIMTQGKDLGNLEKVIQNISNVVSHS